MRSAARDRRYLPGSGTAGDYPIHIIVNNGGTMLLGAVDNEADEQVAEIRARGGSGAFGVDDQRIAFCR